MKRTLPKFRSKEEAALFWENHEVLDHVDPNEFKVVHPGKKPRYAFVNPREKAERQLISLRVDSRLLEKARMLASRWEVGYQSILRSWLERGATRH